ncbi:hypothetical protein BRC93_07850 [Halobacteriales archaeon QS_5_70_15]|nr:MAG: hypothetical protein BRC93_07850 [Halobacteriales archaeon QS_5_70_15]
MRYDRTDGVSLTGPVGDLTLRDRIAGLLSATDTTVVGREPDDPVRLILVAEGVRSASVLRVPALLDRPRNVTLALSIDASDVGGPRPDTPGRLTGPEAGGRPR